MPQPIRQDEYKTWPATAPPPRRLIVGSLTALGIALGGNLGGVTSALIGLDGGKAAGKLKLDALFPVNGYKRCLGPGFELLYPREWLADITLVRRRAERADFERGLAFRQFEDAERLAQQRQVVEPIVGFGPMGGTGEDNISVVKAPSPGLVLTNFGSPERVAIFLLDYQLAPKGSGKVARLLSASSRSDATGLYYELEYQVRKEGSEAWRRHNIAVICAKDDVLYTLNVQSADDRWENNASKFRKAADSFKLTT